MYSIIRGGVREVFNKLGEAMKLYNKQTVYYTCGRYDYTAIDFVSGLGTETLITYIKPKKLALSFGAKVHEVQRRTYEELAMSMLLGVSEHSQELELYTENTGELYKKHYPHIRERAIALFERYGVHGLHTSQSDYQRDVHSLVFNFILPIFRDGSESFNKEMPDKIEFTYLDQLVASIHYYEGLLIEYKCNKLA